MSSQPRDGMSSRLKRFFAHWHAFLLPPGGLLHAAAFVAMGSGLALTLAYDINRPFDSLQVLVLSNPGGAMIRGIHYWSSQFFLVLVVVHLVDQLSSGGERMVSTGTWLRLSFLVPVTLFLMISGFILKADRAALLALQVLEGLLDTFPVGGEAVKSLLVGRPGTICFAYFHHISTATIICLLLTLGHSNRPWPDWNSLVMILGAAMITSVFFMPGLVLEGRGTLTRGPWFFVGLQEMLRWSSSPFWIVIFGALVFLALCLLPLLPRPFSRVVKWFMILFLFFYLGLCVFGFVARGPGGRLALPWG